MGSWDHHHKRRQGLKGGWESFNPIIVRPLQNNGLAIGAVGLQGSGPRGVGLEVRPLSLEKVRLREDSREGSGLYSETWLNQ